MILCAGPQGCFAVAGMAEDGDVTGVHGGDCFEVIHGAAQAPGPCAEGAPFVGLSFGAVGELESVAADAVAPAFEMVGFDVAIVKGGHGVAAFQGEFQGPAGGMHATRGFGGAVVHDAHVGGGSHPAVGERDGGIFFHAGVAEVVQAEENGCGLLRGVVGHVEHQVDRRSGGVIEEAEGDQGAGGEAAHGVFTGGGGFGAEFDGQFGRVAIHEVAEVLQNLGATKGVPFVGGGDAVAVAGEQGIGQGVGGDFGFVVVAAVGGGLGGVGEEGEEQEN